MEQHASLEALNRSLKTIQQSPKERGAVKLIVCRPGTNERNVLDAAELDIAEGLVGDNWRTRGFNKGVSHPDMQINLMNSRTIDAIAASKDRWPLAGDQFYVDLDLSKANLPPGTRLLIGTAIIEVTAEPHLGCRKFSERFGKAAVTFVNSEIGKSLNLRGINAKVVCGGRVETGDVLRKLAP